MSAFELIVEDQGLQSALSTLVARVNNMTPVLQAIGDDIVERAKRRFETSSGPDGQPWQPNAAATLGMVAERIGKHASNVKKGGGLNAQGKRALANKKPLIGESGDLRRQIVSVASNSALVVSSAPVYAAIQQFGGKAGRGHKVTIPARPFLPVHIDGSLYPAEQSAIQATLNEWLVSGLN